ncbi:MAG: EAL domain-containing protein [Pseudomonadota bacterium]
MKRVALPLRLTLPAGLAVAFLLITTISLINGIHNHREAAFATARSDALSNATELARTIEQSRLPTSTIVEARLSRIYTDPRVRTVVVADPQMQVLLSPRQTQTGEALTEVLPDIDLDALRQHVVSRLPGLLETAAPARIEAVQSFAMPGGTATASSSNRGLVFVCMDITEQLDAHRTQALLERLPEVVLMLLIIGMSTLLIETRINRPLSTLRRAAEAIRRGRRAELPPTDKGPAEIQAVAEAFNAMVAAQEETQRKLADNERKLAVTLDSVGDGLIATDLDGQITLINPMAERLTGWDREEALGRSIEEVFVICPADGCKPVQIPLRRVLNEGTLVGLANHTVLLHRDGHRYHITDSAAPIRDPDGELSGVVLVFHDISREYELRDELAESEQHFRNLADNGQALIWTSDLDHRRDYVNRPWLEFTGMTQGTSLSEGWQEAVHPDDLDDLLAAIDSAYQRQSGFTLEYRLRHHSGEYRWVLVKGTPRRDSKGHFIGLMGQCLDISADKEAHERLDYLADHDPLTGLPNRSQLLQRIDQVIRDRRHRQGVGGLFFVDVDAFKQINDLYGLQEGDRMLVEIARRLVATTDEDATVARIGGDEFLVLIPRLAHDPDEGRHKGRELADRLRQIMQEPFELAGSRHLATASVGLTLIYGRVGSAEELLREADIARYRAKEAGRNHFVDFETGMAESVTRRYRLEQELRHALERGEFELYLQSQVGRQETTVGAEVLLRWQSSEHGLVSPAEFIPLAEETGLVIEIGDWVMQEACKLLARLQAHQRSAGGEPITLSVNVSPRQFRSAGFVARLRELVESTGIDPAGLMIEITENVLMTQVDQAIERMQELVDLGLSFSIDDFGTGFSSFTYLKRLPLREIKIDKSFVDGVPDDPANSAMVEAILAMATHLGIEVVAEGVENREQVDFLLDRACDRIQGFHFARPTPAETWLRERLSPSR